MNINIILQENAHNMVFSNTVDVEAVCTIKNIFKNQN